MEKNAREIIARLGQVQREFDQFRQEFERLGTHVGHAKNKYDELDKLAGRLGDRLAMELGAPAQPPLPEPASVNGGEEAR